MNKIIKDGFQYPTYDENQDHVLGGLISPSYPIINLSGDWRKNLPGEEPQSNLVEDTNGCTNWGTLSQLQILASFQFNKKENWEERFQAVMSGQSRTGNDPQSVYNSIRHHGALKAPLLPYTDKMDFAEYLSPKPMTAELKRIAKKWGYDIEHKYLYPPRAKVDRKALIIEGLKRSPVGISVYAWQEENGLYVKPKGAPDVHWCVAIKHEENFLWVWDSYFPFIKKVSWEEHFDIAVEVKMEEARLPFYCGYFPNLCK